MKKQFALLLIALTTILSQAMSVEYGVNTVKPPGITIQVPVSVTPYSETIYVENLEPPHVDSDRLWIIYDFTFLTIPDPPEFSLRSDAYRTCYEYSGYLTNYNRYNEPEIDTWYQTAISRGGRVA